MSIKFSIIGIIGKYADPSVAETVEAAITHLLSRNCTVFLDDSTAQNIPENQFPCLSRAELGEKCDLVIVIGGDGTLLNAARSLNEFEIPLVGVNLGRRGFLVDVSPLAMREKLDEILAGNYMVENRFLIQSWVERDGKRVFEGDALNDVVIHKWEVARMIEFDTYIDGHYVHTNRSDGMIVSTPTGSTAYALSGGGPILHPSLHAVVLVPICPHTLSNRPIVVDAKSKIEIVINHGSKHEGQISYDGQLQNRLEVGDRVHIQSKASQLHLLHPRGYDYFEVLRDKLHWAEHH